ncbi:class I SAM-dependent methyltransferase [Sphingosinicella soli]|uniref:NADH dehydrogenase [ubiquinone] 1 alpha subcomplex assembly factor 7 n=1 Tax=Sphingosinicella soli TaxID=333708 RepID=A0A7W7B0H9_9SPHN|nr:SAM-dependent methyltransferase [Sphingosinicella soli]MBB4631796.1 NADH dehydrogenase [ubiquinone] 1 alpha subcomplex assembly factor 7 [Sphingosinicella soli]
MTPLGRKLAAEIARGPIGVDRYMAECVAAYYAGRDPFGRGGDFTTAPEISQMFGEIIGLWMADLWDRAGRPARVNLVELGPGRGTLMADLLRAARTLPAFADAIAVHFVETSPTLRAAQAQRIPTATWHDDLSGVPQGAPLLVIANEFFDALPIRQDVYFEGAWHERRIGLSADNFVYIPQAETIRETSPARARYATTLAARIAADGGAALLIDYGYEGPAEGDTLQALAAHTPTDPLAAPGEHDLTAHVDFTALAEAGRAAGTHVSPLTLQGPFLRALGIEARAERLSRGLDPEARHAIAGAMRRLTLPQTMGSLFKVLAFTHKDWPEPSGFGA